MSDPERRRRRFGEVRWLDEVASTNTWVLEAAEAGAPEGTVVVADRQSAGRGRLGRRWESAAGSGLLASLLFRPSLDPADLFCVSALVALAACDACASVASVRPGLKWPNDLVVEDRKLAGVLSETRGLGTPELAVVVGIGINVSWPLPGPEASELGATCLEAEGIGPIDRRALLDELLAGVEDRRDLLDDPAGRDGLVRDAAAGMVTIGRLVRVETAEGFLSGTALGLDEHGRLLLDAGGTRHAVSVADVVHLR